MQRKQEAMLNKLSPSVCTHDMESQFWKADGFEAEIETEDYITVALSICGGEL